MRVSYFLKSHPKILQDHIVVGNWIRQGLVEVNGLVVKKNIRLNPNRSTVRIYLDEKWLDLPYTNPNKQVLIFCKPRGYLCTHYDPFDRPIIYSLLPEQFRQFRSAGRLDQDSEGLLVLSNDGYFISDLCEPIYQCTKVYLVGLVQPLPEEFFTQASDGEFVIIHEKEPTKLLPCEVFAVRSELDKYSYLNFENNYHWYQFNLHEGKTNQIRQMCQQFDNPVQRLIRVKQGEFQMTEKLWQQKLIKL
jgi:pseudouridine synthase